MFTERETLESYSKLMQQCITARKQDWVKTLYVSGLCSGQCVKQSTDIIASYLSHVS